MLMSGTLATILLELVALRIACEKGNKKNVDVQHAAARVADVGLIVSAWCSALAPRSAASTA